MTRSLTIHFSDPYTVEQRDGFHSITTARDEVDTLARVVEWMLENRDLREIEREGEKA